MVIKCAKLASGKATRISDNPTIASSNIKRASLSFLLASREVASTAHGREVTLHGVALNRTKANVCLSVETKAKAPSNGTKTASSGEAKTLAKLIRELCQTALKQLPIAKLSCLAKLLHKRHLAALE